MKVGIMHVMIHHANDLQGRNIHWYKKLGIHQSEVKILSAAQPNSAMTSQAMLAQ